jgi:uncharacterized membrane protein
MYRDFIPFLGEHSVVKRFEKVQNKHFTLPAAIGISLSKIVESGVLVSFGVAKPVNIVAWVVAFFVFFVLFLLTDEFNVKRRIKDEI